MKWIEEHRAVCNKDEDTCEQCYHIGESLWAMSQAQEYIDQKKNQNCGLKTILELIPFQ